MGLFNKKDEEEETEEKAEEETEEKAEEETEEKAEESTKKGKKKSRKDANAVYIGKKPTMKYVMAAMMVLEKGEECVVKARGRSISHAVDVCEILKHRFLKGVEYEDIVITTEKLESDDGEIHNVSSIELFLSPP